MLIKKLISFRFIYLALADRKSSTMNVLANKLLARFWKFMLQAVLTRRIHPTISTLQARARSFGRETFFPAMTDSDLWLRSHPIQFLKVQDRNGIKAHADVIMKDLIRSRESDVGIEGLEILDRTDYLAFRRSHTLSSWYTALEALFWRKFYVNLRACLNGARMTRRYTARPEL